MSFVTLHGRLLRWGNSFGLRLGKEDVERLRITPGSDVTVKVEVPGGRIRVKDIRRYDLGGKAADEHDALFAAEAAREHGRSRT